MKIQAITAAALFAIVASSNVQAAPAAVITDLGCNGFVPDPDNEGGSLGGLFVDTHHVVITNSKKGNKKITCKFDHDVELKSASGAKGFICNVFDELSDNSYMIATPGGKATLVCKINGSNK